MLSFELYKDQGLAIVQPSGPLAKEDFEKLSVAVNNILENGGKMRGIVIYSKSFPGWEDFAGFASHLQFVRGHHTLIQRLAVCTDSPVGKIGPRLVNHFTAAEVRHFPHAQFEQAKVWVLAA